MQADDGKDYDDINVTPMVDLYLVLLLIFIIMTTAAVQGMKVQLPSASKSSAAANPNAPKVQAIIIGDNGQIELNREPVTLGELERRLGALKATTPDLPAVVRGNRATQYEAIMDVLDVLARLKITKIGLATQPAKS
ncbi:biopolymer transporter ExbD [Luteolibacter flavescens]|uniref:Biopolymer transporter ExbD n=1 Tax=Luteolibacter flavescens TaxID=1859460 RepID=A0ABT3FV42_9BACT|nr:biopolymer transporter ExbD [Luteolibacter flavescens]MCW1887287.1 biopolymer transporter ExbD [Luteolibacter flavescens]